MRLLKIINVTMNTLIGVACLIGALVSPFRHIPSEIISFTALWAFGAWCIKWANEDLKGIEQ